MCILSQIYFYSSLSSINVGGLGGCSRQCHEEILLRSCDFHCTGCEGALAAVHSADQHVIEACYQQHPAGWPCSLLLVWPATDPYTIWSHCLSSTFTTLRPEHFLTINKTYTNKYYLLNWVNFICDNSTPGRGITVRIVPNYIIQISLSDILDWEICFDI